MCDPSMEACGGDTGISAGQRHRLLHGAVLVCLSMGSAAELSSKC